VTAAAPDNLRGGKYMARTIQFYTYTEKKIGGKRRRISERRYPTKAEAVEMARIMNKLYKGRFTYTAIKAPAPRR